MQKFRDYVYCDEEKMKSYISQITELSKTKASESYERTTEVDGKGDLALVKFGTTANEKNSKVYTMNINPMENFITWVCDKKNAINYDGENLEFGDKDKLIIFNGKMTMPEMGENMEIFNTLAKNTALFDMVPISDEDREKLAFVKETDNIPILLELDSDYIFSANLKKDSIIGDKDDFLDNLDDEITIIGRIDKIHNSNEKVEIYDLAKEIFKLNRSIRRKIPKESLDGAIIYENGPLIKITPLIIYK